MLQQVDTHTHTCTHPTKAASLVKSYGSPTCFCLTVCIHMPCQPFPSTPTPPHPSHMSVALPLLIAPLCGLKDGGREQRRGKAEQRRQTEGVQDRGRRGKALWGLGWEFWLCLTEEKRCGGGVGCGGGGRLTPWSNLPQTAPTQLIRS